VRAGSSPGGVDVRLRIGLHRGRPALTDIGYVGLSVHAAARICFAARRTAARS
jgi:class 3 adenylate cyclase